MTGRDELAVTRLQLGAYQANCYVVASPSTRQAIIIDAPGSAQEILPYLEGLHVALIALTHTHPDHTEALGELRRAVDAPVGVHPAEAMRLQPAAERLLGDGEEVKVGGAALRVLHTPGHTAGSICLHHAWKLFSGDTLFPGGPGKTMRPQDFRTILDSIRRRLLPLSDGTEVLPGHGEPTVLGKEKAEFASFTSRPHPPDLCGDVVWLTS